MKQLIRWDTYTSVLTLGGYFFLDGLLGATVWSTPCPTPAQQMIVGATWLIGGIGLYAAVQIWKERHNAS